MGNGTEIEVELRSIAAGGDAVGRDRTGRVVFVSGALPGEKVRAALRSEQARFAKADLVEVLETSTDRVAPECSHVADGCGGCGLAHAAPDAQRRYKLAIISDAIERLGGVEDPPVQPGPVLPRAGFRTTVRAAVSEGRAGYRVARSDERLAVGSCRVLHPLLEELLCEGRFGGTDEVTLRVGARTGERLALASPTATDVRLPADVTVVGSDELRSGRRAWYHEEVAGRRLRISAGSFFQSRPDGAEALVDAASGALGDLEPGSSIVDLYCGVGLFAATSRVGCCSLAVERSESSVADARVNLAGSGTRVVRSSIERWRPSKADAVIADPPRSGLGEVGVRRISATGAGLLVLVSCDAPALGRDVRLLAAQGWNLDWSRLVDLFVDTPHVEVVSRFSR